MAVGGFVVWVEGREEVWFWGCCCSWYGYRFVGGGCADSGEFQGLTVWGWRAPRSRGVERKEATSFRWKKS